MSDERYAIVLEEARRALDQQSDTLDSLRDRASGTLTVAGLAAAFLGGLAIRDGSGFGAFTWLAVVAFIAANVLVVCVQIPRSLAWWQDPNVLVTWVEDHKADTGQIQRDLALHLRQQHEVNQGVISRLGWLYVATLGCVLLEIAALTLDLR